MVRCFIGIFLPETVKSEVINIQEGLKRLPIECKLVEKDNLHISLSFLGEIDDGKIEEIKKKLVEICSSITKFKVIVHQLKLIPTEKYVRVIALDVFDEQKMLIALSKMIKEEIGGDAKPPHITLCRVKNITDKQLFAQKIKELEIKTSEFVVDKICLIKSELRRQGPFYSMLDGASLV